MLRAAIGIGVYAGAFAVSFGAVAVGSGFSLAQTMVLSLVMFSGASQFAFVGVAAAAGSPFAAIPAALLLGVRNAFYGVPVSEILQPRGWARLWTAHFVIDETTGMALAQSSERAKRHAFWATGLILFTLWLTGTFIGASVGAAIDPDDLRPGRGCTGGVPGSALAGAAAPDRPAGGARRGSVAVVLIPLVPAGIPVIAAAGVALLAGLVPPPEPLVTGLWVALLDLLCRLATCSSSPASPCPTRC